MGMGTIRAGMTGRGSLPKTPSFNLISVSHCQAEDVQEVGIHLPSMTSPCYSQATWHGCPPLVRFLKLIGAASGQISGIMVRTSL